MYFEGSLINFPLFYTDQLKFLDICYLPPKLGSCNAKFMVWAYNPMTQKCQQFVYGGCGGNANNFWTREKCEAACPSVRYFRNIMLIFSAFFNTFFTSSIRNPQKMKLTN